MLKRIKKKIKRLIFGMYREKYYCIVLLKKKKNIKNAARLLREAFPCMWPGRLGPIGPNEILDVAFDADTHRSMSVLAHRHHSLVWKGTKVNGVELYNITQWHSLCLFVSWTANKIVHGNFSSEI